MASNNDRFTPQSGRSSKRPSGKTWTPEMQAAGSQEWKDMIAMQLSGSDSKVMALADSADTEWLAVSESYSQAWGTGDRHH